MSYEFKVGDIVKCVSDDPNDMQLNIDLRIGILKEQIIGASTIKKRFELFNKLEKLIDQKNRLDAICLFDKE